MQLKSLYKISYYHGHSSSQKPLIFKTIGRQVFENAHSHPSNIALISHSQNKILNYQQLFEKGQKVAASLVAMGLKEKDRVGVYSSNNYEWVLMQVATALSNTILGKHHLGKGIFY
jgi:fatty-acyl-CoA synthase